MHVYLLGWSKYIFEVATTMKQAPSKRDMRGRRYGTGKKRRRRGGRTRNCRNKEREGKDSSLRR